MQDIIYDPDAVGIKFLNKRGNLSKIRKYHMTKQELISARKRWLKEVKDIDNNIRNKAGNIFFNPYRRGIYYYQVQTLFLLGANQWHSLASILKKFKIYTSNILLNPIAMKKSGFHTVWDRFKSGNNSFITHTKKDHIGRIQENFIMLQRLSRLHPYGYKLHQACAAIDIKRESCKGFSQGIYYYRLSTYSTMSKALPIKDFSKFLMFKDEYRYNSNKFIGTIIPYDIEGS